MHNDNVDENITGSGDNNYHGIMIMLNDHGNDNDDKKI